MRLKINDDFFISDFSSSDKPALLEHLNEKQIYDQTLNIPFPYTGSDAEKWLERIRQQTANQSGQSIHWAIRQNCEGFLIGGIGFLALQIGKDHKAEIGYWLAKPYWQKGIMTAAVKGVVEYGFREFGLLRIVAHVFASNTASARVLEKSGFQCEGTLRSHYKKDGKIFDGKLYAIVNEKT